MASEPSTGANGVQVTTGAQPQEGASQALEAEARSPQAGGADHESGTADIAQLRRERQAADREAQRLRSELKAYVEAHKAAEDAKLSEVERATKRATAAEQELASLRQQLTDERVQSRVMAAAQRLGFADPGDAYQLLDRADLVIEDGQPRNVDKLLKELLTKKPYLASSTARATGSAEGGVRGGIRTTTDMNALIRQAAGR
jgi:hypothetical protein